MSETKFTYGPWRVCDGSDPLSCIETLGGMTVAWAHQHPIRFGRIPDETVTANAHLISAAPDLYAALEAEDALIVSAQKLIASYLPPGGISKDALVDGLIELFDGPRQRDVQSRSNAALAKARGESQ